MKQFLLIFLGMTLLSACVTDQQIQDSFSGEYEVTIEAPEAEKEMQNAKKDMKKDLDEAKEDIRDEIKKAKKDIEKEFGEDSDFGKAISSFVEGMGHFAEGMTDLGESLGEMGINLGAGLLKNVRFHANFQRDGEVVFGKRNKVKIENEDLRWKIKNGKLILWNEDDESEEDADEFEIVQISKNEIDLIGKDVIFHLIKKEKER